MRPAEKYHQHDITVALVVLLQQEKILKYVS